MMKVLNYKQMLEEAEFLNKEAERLLKTGMTETGFCILLRIQVLLDSVRTALEDRNN